jgi:AcrR family transcriptional regulator
VGAVQDIGSRRRSESREQTRQRLLRVGRAVFARKGHAGTNLKQDILGPAGVSVGSFYHQFKDKTDLLLAILRDHSETFRAMIRDGHRQDLEQPPGAVARHGYEIVFRVAEENEDLFRIMARERESTEPRVRAYLRENYRLWVAALADDYRRIGRLAGDENEATILAAELVMSLTLGALLTYLEGTPGERAANRERLIDGLVQFTLGGVAVLVAGVPVPLPPSRPHGSTPARVNESA